MGRVRQTGLLLPHQHHHLFHLCHPLHHLHLEQLVQIDTYSQLISSLSILNSLSLYLYQPDIAGSIGINPGRA